MESTTTAVLLLELPASSTLKKTSAEPAADCWKLTTSINSAVVLRQCASASANAAW
jgi:hypothetical protein